VPQVGGPGTQPGEEANSHAIAQATKYKHLTAERVLHPILMSEMPFDLPRDDK
jgi:hypothetical protein